MIIWSYFIGRRWDYLWQAGNPFGKLAAEFHEKGSQVIGTRRFFDYTKTFSFTGLAVAALFFAAAVTPSLLPRHYLFQGILCGFALALGYAVGVSGVLLFQFLEFRQPSSAVQMWSKRITTLVVALFVIASLRQATFWQNSIRERMEMPPVETFYPFRTFVIAAITGIALHLLSRLLIKSCVFLNRRLHHYVPRRVSLVLSICLVTFLAFFIGEGVIARGLLTVADRIFLLADEVIDEEIDQPTSSQQTGSPDSLVPWDSIGRWGKNFIAAGPTASKIAAFSGKESQQPLRVYVGLRSADSDQDRAALALKELQRVGGFERSTLIIATPTGTGWLDPGAVDTVEYLQGGDTTIVSMQYSYLPSWMTIIVDPRRSIDSARALFNEVYDYWVTLPVDSRPKLYLHGLSLGSLGSEVSADIMRLLDEPIQGGLFSGPPFPSTQWNRLTASRNPDSPQWLPQIRDGQIVRFMNQNEMPHQGKPWGKMRYVYIEYASDPMVFFSPSLAYRQPDWLKGQRGEDVSPHLRWYPLVTFLQIGFDLPMATSIPTGYGHNYAPADYIDGWQAILENPYWNDSEIQRLKQHFTQGEGGRPL